VSGPDEPTASEPFDIAVIGGGVVGCAVLRSLALGGRRAVLLEQGADILSGASKANSAILHTGFDAPPGSIELACMRAGHAEYLAIREPLNLPLLATSAVLVAWNEAELARLPEIVGQAHANGIGDVRPLGLDELRAREPHVAHDARGAVLVPAESVIDPWSAPLAYALQSIAHGARVRCGTRVHSGTLDSGPWRLDTSTGPVSAQVVVNCAGNEGDLVEAIARPSPFAIRPRKGQFVVYDKSSAPLLSAILLPVPTERTKGIVVTPTIFGNLLVGPTAEDQDDRRTASVEHDTLATLMAQGRRLIPALDRHAVTATYAGLRPATQFKDYQIEAVPTRRWITVSGIRSTGLTAALGIADRVRTLYADHFGPIRTEQDPIWTPVPNLAEHRPRPWQDAGRSPIICHCEMVTAAEIADACAGALPAGDLGGLKRRTRCMMGRCQGFHCSARVAEILPPHLGRLMARVAAD
jgi:glycerol-3-phosphate dehydrogenase